MKTEEARKAVLEAYCSQAYNSLQLMYAFWSLLSEDSREHWQAWLQGEFESLASYAEHISEVVGQEQQQ